VRLNGQKSVKFFLTALSAFADIGAPMKKKASFIQTGLSQTIASIDQRESRNQPPRRRMSKFRLMCTSAIVIVTWSGFSALGTVYNSDGTATSVQYLHDNFAQDGDTITLPAGTFTWSTPVTISKAIVIEGGGSGRIIGDTKSSVQVGTGPETFITTRSGLPITAGQTLRIAKMPHPPGGGGSESVPPARGTYMEGTVTSYSGTTLEMNITSTAGSGTWTFWWIATQPTTTIVDAYQGNGNSYDAMLKINQSLNGSTEITGLRFLADPNSSHRSTFIGLFTSVYITSKTLIHDCWFENDGGGAAAIFAASNQGLVWNCSFDDTFSQNAVAVVQKWEFGGGDVSWTTNSTMGADDTNGATNFYVEDCDFHAYLNAFDIDSNTRIVWRHNIDDNSGLGSHGADTGPIGTRHAEIYDNELVFDTFGDCDGSTTLPVCWFFWMRGGTGVITDNILPAISSCAWGNKGNVLFSVLNNRRNTGAYCCWTSYPAPHQVGQGYGTGAVFHAFISICPPYVGVDFSYFTYTEPVYIWNNTGTGSDTVGLNQDPTDQCGNGQQVANYVQQGRDYIVASKPGYTKFTYPHPLRSQSSPTPTPTPTATPTPTPTPIPSPTPTVSPTPTPPPPSRKLKRHPHP
jgi:hypothetical protein